MGAGEDWGDRGGVGAATVGEPPGAAGEARGVAGSPLQAIAATRATINDHRLPHAMTPLYPYPARGVVATPRRADDDVDKPKRANVGSRRRHRVTVVAIAVAGALAAVGMVALLTKPHPRASR